MRRLLILALIALPALAAATSAPAAGNGVSWSGIVIGVGGSPITDGAARFHAIGVDATGVITQLSLSFRPLVGDRVAVTNGVEASERGLPLLRADQSVPGIVVKKLGTAAIALVKDVQIDIVRDGAYQFLSRGGATPDYWDAEVAYDSEQASWVLDASANKRKATIVISIRKGKLLHLSPRATAKRGPQSQAQLAAARTQIQAYLNSLTTGRFNETCKRTTKIALAKVGGRATCEQIFEAFGGSYMNSRLHLDEVTLSGSENEIAFVKITRSLALAPEKSRQATVMFLREAGQYRFHRELN